MEGVMNNDLRRQIHSNMNLKETDELLEVWQTNDRVEWTEITFEVIKEILKYRGVEIPEQDEPIYEHPEEADNESYVLSVMERQTLNYEIFPYSTLPRAP